MTELMVFESIKIDDRMVFEELMFLSLLTGNTSQCALQESGRGFGRYKKKGSSGTKRGAAKVKTETAAKRGTSRAKRKR